MIALMSFNFTFVIFQFTLAILGAGGWGMFFLGFPLAGMVAGSLWVYLNNTPQVGRGRSANVGGDW